MFENFGTLEIDTPVGACLYILAAYLLRSRAWTHKQGSVTLVSHTCGPKYLPLQGLDHVIIGVKITKLLIMVDTVAWYILAICMLAGHGLEAQKPERYPESTPNSHRRAWTLTPKPGQDEMDFVTRRFFDSYSGPFAES